MSVFYKLRKNNDRHMPKACGKWFARAYYPETVSLHDLARIMQSNSTVKHSDIVAVLTELADAMRHELQAGRKVRIDGLGTFKMGLSSRGVDNPDDFSPIRDVLSMHVIFNPEKERNANGQKQQSMTIGAKAIQLPVYNVN